MNDPRQPMPGGTPRPAAVPQQHPVHPQQHPQAHPQQTSTLPRPGVAPQHPQQHAQPGLRPAVAPAHHPQPAHPTGPAKIAPMPAIPPSNHNEEAIELIDDGEASAEVIHKKIKAFGGIEGPKATKWKRDPLAHDKSPMRVRTFHAKLSDQGLEYLDDAINHFIDDHPEVHVKFVTTNIGMFDGKFKDFALIVNVWY